jgi:hypothetical protein
MIICNKKAERKKEEKWQVSYSRGCNMYISLFEEYNEFFSLKM